MTKFEKLDRKVEETIREVETMDKRKKFYKNGFVFAGGLALVLNLDHRNAWTLPDSGESSEGLKFMVSEPSRVPVQCVDHFRNRLRCCIGSLNVGSSPFRSYLTVLADGIGIANGVNSDPAYDAVYR